MKLPSFPGLPKDTFLILAVVASIVAIIGGGNFLFKSRPPMPVLQLTSAVNLLGRAGVQPLDTVAGKDTTLKSMLTEIEKIHAIDYFTRAEDVNEMVVNILFRWTGADMVAPQAYGPYIDARVVGVLLALDGAPETVKEPRQLSIDEVAPLNEMWFRIYDHYRIRLLTQMGGRMIFSDGVSYDLANDKLNITGVISADFIAELQQALQSTSNSADVIRAFLDYIDRTKGFDTLNDQEQDLIMGLKPAEPTPVPAPEVPAVLPQ